MPTYEWIRTKERMPKQDQLIYFVSELGASFIGKYIKGEWYSNHDYWNPIEKGFNITHWTSLPELPNR